MCTLTIQPFFPRISLIDSLTLKNDILKVITTIDNVTFPVTSNIQTTPSGIISWDWDRINGYFAVNQIFGNGLIFNAFDASVIEENICKIYFSRIALQILATIETSTKLFCKIGYVGNVQITIKLENVENATIIPIIPQGFRNPSENNLSLLSNYDWGFDTDTEELQKHMIDLLRSIFEVIYTSFNYNPPQDNLYTAFFRNIGIQFNQ
jgi:hypothetical protein